MSQKNVEVVRHVDEAWARDEFPGPLGFLDPQIEYASALVGPLDSAFSPRDHKLAVGLNYGLAILLYVIAGALVRRALTAPALGWRRPLR